MDVQIVHQKNPTGLLKRPYFYALAISNDVSIFSSGVLKTCFYTIKMFPLNYS